MTRLILACALLLLAGCSGDDGLPTGPSPVSATIEIQYQTSPVSTTEADGATPSLQCSGRARIHPSWWGFAQASMPPLGTGSWVALFEEVPIGRQVIRVGAPEGCTGESVIAVNGTVLTEGAELPFSGDTAFSFTVHSDGSVSP